MPGEAKLSRWLKPANRVVIALQRLSLAIGTMRLISIPGRKSGKLRTTPVSPLTVDSKRYIVGGFPRADWVKNARTAGWGIAARGRNPWQRYLTSKNKSSNILIIKSTYRRSPLALAVLGLLYEAPVHPYRMQRLIKERGKDEVINVRQRASIYQTIERLQRLGLIVARETTREARWPERTVYELSDEGRRTFRAWMHEVLSTPAREFPEFPAAVAFLPLLTPEEALRELETRVAALEDEVARIDSQLSGAAAEGLPRLFLLETEYQRATLEAELEWVRAVVDDLRTGGLTWSEEWLRKYSEEPAAAPDGEERDMTS